MANEKRYYYKKDGKAAYNLKEPLENILPEEELADYVEITKEEWDALTYVEPVPEYVPTAEELARQEKEHQIAEAKAYLARTDYIVIKIAEADTAEEAAAIRVEYADIILERRAKRALINQLEAELA